jgi:hypothetical protein
MVTHTINREQPDLDEFGDFDFTNTRRFLAEHGVDERDLSEYCSVEVDVLRAIRARGWEPSLERDDKRGGWLAFIQEWPTDPETRLAVGRGRDRMTALLHALRHALDWRTPEEIYASFNEATLDLVGLTADEFLRKWENNELPSDNSRVIHLLMLRPR